MDDVETIFSDLLDESLAAGVVTEASDRTIPGGSYRLDVVKKSMETASDASPWPGRVMVRIQADASLKNGEGEFTRKGRIFFDASPQVMRDKNEKLDAPSRLWANLVAVVGRGSSHRKVYEYLGEYPLLGTVTRTFKKLDGKWARPTNKQEENELLDEGAEPRNFVQTLRVFNG
jgi:hypothetical protein